MAPFAERDVDIANAWMEGLGNVVVPREPLLPLSHSVNSKLTTLCPRLDAWLRGGVPTRSVTEIAGEAGSAKTQLALQLLIAAQLPREMGGLDGAAVYVDTEGRAPLSRLKQLVASHPAVCKYTEAKKKTKTDSEIDLMNGVYVAETLDDPDGLWTALVSVASVLSATGDDGLKKKKKPVRLLVVDSVSSPFRESDASRASGAFSRARVLGRVAALLREYAHRHDVAVVVTNHVVDAFGSENDNAEYNADLKRLKDHSKKKNVRPRRRARRAAATSRRRWFVLGQLREHAIVPAPVGGSAAGSERGRGWRRRRGGVTREGAGVLVAPAALQGRGGRRRADAVRRAKGGRLRSSFRGRFGGRAMRTFFRKVKVLDYLQYLR